MLPNNLVNFNDIKMPEELSIDQSDTLLSVNALAQLGVRKLCGRFTQFKGTRGGRPTLISLVIDWSSCPMLGALRYRESHILHATLVPMADQQSLEHIHSVRRHY